VVDAAELENGIGIGWLDHLAAPLAKLEM